MQNLIRVSLVGLVAIAGFFKGCANEEKDVCASALEGVSGFVCIEPGSFSMGSPEHEPGREASETQHMVTLSRAFLMEATPVTQAGWKELMEISPAFFDDCSDHCPVEYLSWYSALFYANARSDKEGLDRCYALDGCEGLASAGDLVHCSVTVNTANGSPYDCLGYRLPTEAEWEYAARAGSSTAFFAGEITNLDCLPEDPSLEPAGWYCGNSVDHPHPVSEKQPNAWGLYDVHGNVWEWVWDRYEDYTSDSLLDPKGPEVGSGRIVRGGSWSATASACRSAKRSWLDPDERDGDLGLRLCRTVH